MLRRLEGDRQAHQSLVQPVFPLLIPLETTLLPLLKRPNPSDLPLLPLLCLSLPPSFLTYKSNIPPYYAYFYTQRTREEHREIQRLAVMMRRLKEENRRLRSEEREYAGGEDLELQIALQNSGEE